MRIHCHWNCFCLLAIFFNFFVFIRKGLIIEGICGQGVKEQTKDVETPRASKNESHHCPRVEDTMGGNFVTRVSEIWSSLRGHGHGGMGCCQREGAEAGLG